MVVVTRRIPLSEATEKEKLNFAKKSRRRTVLDELASDNSEKVKLTLFQNPCLSYETVANILEKDTNKNVQLAVKKYWDKKVESNLLFMLLIKFFFSEIPDLKNDKIKKAITAYLCMMQCKYKYTYQDEQGNYIYFSMRSSSSHIAFSKDLEDKFEEFDYLYKNKHKIFEDKIKYQDKVYQDVLRVKKWFEETKRPVGMDDYEWLIELGKLCIAIRKGSINFYLGDEKYSLHNEALTEFWDC